MEFSLSFLVRLNAPGPFNAKKEGSRSESITDLALRIREWHSFHVIDISWKQTVSTWVGLKFTLGNLLRHLHHEEKWKNQLNLEKNTLKDCWLFLVCFGFWQIESGDLAYRMVNKTANNINTWRGFFHYSEICTQIWNFVFFCQVRNNQSSIKEKEPKWQVKPHTINRVNTLFKEKRSIKKTSIKHIC